MPLERMGYCGIWFLVLPVHGHFVILFFDILYWLLVYSLVVRQFHTLHSVALDISSTQLGPTIVITLFTVLTMLYIPVTILVHLCLNILHAWCRTHTSVHQM